MSWWDVQVPSLQENKQEKQHLANERQCSAGFVAPLSVWSREPSWERHLLDEITAECQLIDHLMARSP